ncbi:Uu.00g025410.m01.CDS01 [Anthostomella pinea]|uniref:Uu.00g025410.m01.CDS01 n=1 Tax=Anthostomella pinea TaxID=933095 RepID=A0AAI8V2J3_9PEZI|nr:Uu.00g025410.m01.CDS01 [Anthostomella pinea]
MTGPVGSGKVLSPASLAHVVLRTPNFKPMVAFHKAFLGAHASHETETLAFLTYDEEHHRVAIIAFTGCGEKVRNTAGLEHIAFTFKNLLDLTTAYSQRKARGMLPVWNVNHGPTTSIYYQDPDGNMLETQVDNFDTAEGANDYMSGGAFAENPFGVDFDPEDMIRRLQSGEPEVELKKRPNIGPRGIETFPVLPKPDVRDSYELMGVST